MIENAYPDPTGSGERYVVGVDYGTLSGRALVVRVSDGAELGTAVHEYRHGVIDTTLPATGEGAAARTGRCRTRTTTATCCATRCRPRWPPAGVDPAAGGRHRDRLHRVHGAARARRRHAAVRAARAARPSARVREAVEAPRRPAARRPDQRAGARARRAVDRPLRREDLRGVAVRQGAAAAGGGPGGLPTGPSAGSRPPTGSSGSCAVSRPATSAPPATRASTRTGATRPRTTWPR